MPFASLPFAVFLAAVVTAYYLAPRRFRWIVLLCASLAFYWLGGGWTVVYLAATVLTTWLAGLALGRANGRLKSADEAARARQKRRKKAVVAVTLVFNFGMLFVLKYWDVTAEQAARLFGGEVLRLGLLLPLGVSFYIFQTVGYVIDCYRGKVKPEPNPAKFALFASFFPQMIQGPISRWADLSPQLLSGGVFSADNLKYGLQLMLWGYLKKLVISDRAGVLVDSVFSDYASHGGAMLALAVGFYCIQLYCDFSGGIDIARGAARLLGIDLKENFRRPLFARSLSEYWRRWHITLGQWMRDYVFYPIALSKPFGALGKRCRKRFGNAVGKILPASLATFLVYLLIGLWHGANFRYILYGFYNGAIITLSLLLENRFYAAKQKLGIRDEAPLWRLFQTLRTGLIVFVGRYITRAPRFLAALWMLSRLFVNPDFGALTDGSVLNLGLPLWDIVVVLAGTLAVVLLEAFEERHGDIRLWLEERNGFVQWAAMVLPLCALFYLGILRGEYVSAAFIYQQF